MKTIFKQLAQKGLNLSGDVDSIPEGFLRRYRGIASWSREYIRTRYGSTKLYDLNAHSLYYFSGQWYSGVSTSLYRGNSEIISGLSGDDLYFTAMAPVSGAMDYLFVVGGEALYKIDSDGDYYNWGIEPPTPGPSIATGAAGNLTGDYQYHITYLNSITGHRSNPDTGTPFGLLLHCDGADEGVVFTDDSDYAHTVTPHGTANTEQASPKFGTASAQFDGNSDYLTIPDHASLNPDYATGTFTFDCWVKFTSIGAGPETHTIYYKGASSSYYMSISYYKSSTESYISAKIMQGGSALANLSYNVTPVAGTWYHIALTRNTSSTALFWNGTLVHGNLNGGAFSVPGSVYLGAYKTPSNYLNGELDEVRFISGVVAFPSGGFTPAVSAYSGMVITITASSDTIDLTNIPESDDAQVDTVEIWRTVANGSVFFKLIGISNGTTSYTDNVEDDDLASIELPFDNNVPYSWFDDCFGPWNASMFWITRSEEGERGRLYYSAVGRAEAMQGFIEVTSDSDGLQKILSYGGNLFVVSRSRVFQVYGTNPYYTREVFGIPGTNKPRSVAVTPYGVMWEANEGIQLFTGGSVARRIGYEKVAPIFCGQAVENLFAFSGNVATYARGEYFMSDDYTTLALDIENERWRDLGIVINVFHYAPEVDILGASWDNDIISLEAEGTTQDVATDIEFDIRTKSLSFDVPNVIEKVRVDADTNGATIACWAQYTNEGVNLGNLSTSSLRQVTEFDAGARLTNRMGLTLSGDVSEILSLHAIEIIHHPLNLILILGDQVIEIPSRFSGDRQYLYFEAFSDMESSLQAVYLIRRVFYDIDSNDETLTLTLRRTNETGTESDISLGTVDTATQTVGEINIGKKGRFKKLTIAGDFTASIAVRRIELICENLRREG